MNRRDLFQRIAGAVAASAVPATVRASTIEAITPPDPIATILGTPPPASATSSAPALVVIEVPMLLANDDRQYIGQAIRRALEGSPFAQLPIVVLDDQVRLTILDAGGRVLNRPLEEEGPRNG